MKVRSLRRRRWLWIGAALLLLAWLVPAVFVGVYDPGVAHEPTVFEDALTGGEPRFFLLSHGYVKAWSVEGWSTKAWEGEDEAAADKHRADYHVERGPLDRHAGTFTLAVSCSMDHAEDLEALRLFVTSDSRGDGGDERRWTRVAEAVIEEPGAAKATLTCRAEVPASSTAYRLQEVRGGVPTGGFSQSMLTAPTFLGRAYDRIAWLPLFKWVPDLR